MAKHERNFPEPPKRAVAILALDAGELALAKAGAKALADVRFAMVTLAEDDDTRLEAALNFDDAQRWLERLRKLQTD